MIRSHLLIPLPSSPTLSSDGTSRCVGPAGTWPWAEVRGCPVVVGCAAVSDSDCGWRVEAGAAELVSCAVWAGWDEKAVRGSLVRRALPSVGELWCGGVGLCAVGVDERPSAAAESEDVGAVLHQFKTVQRILQRKRAVHAADKGNSTPPCSWRLIPPSDVKAAIHNIFVVRSHLSWDSVKNSQHNGNNLFHTLFVLHQINSTIIIR